MRARWIRTTAGIAVAGALLLAERGAAEASAGEVRVMLQNDNVVPEDVTARARAEVTRLFASIDVTVVWVPALQDEARRVRVVKITNWEPAGRAIPETALGVTYTGDHGTRRAYVMWPRVQRQARRSAVGFDTMLAIAVAHEMGHMLLPTGSHATDGLMRASWNANDLRLAAAGLLHFSRESAVRIAQGLRPGAAIAGR